MKVDIKLFFNCMKFNLVKDRQIIQTQKLFFEQLNKYQIEYQVATDAQDVFQKIDNLLNSKTE